MCERCLRVTGSRSAVGVDGPWAGCSSAFDLTGAVGEAFRWAFGWDDMGPTLVRPWIRRSRGCVAECVADIAGRALGTLARMWSWSAAETHSGKPTGADSWASVTDGGVGGSWI